MGDPSPEAWSRLQRYASWMRRVSVDDRDFFGEDTARQFRLNAPAGGWFPAMQSLTWTILTPHLLYIDLFFSPHLESVRIYTSTTWSHSRFPRDILPALASTISVLPTSTLQKLSIGAMFGASLSDTPWAYFKDSFSSAILRCGPPLVKLVSPIPLSDAAVNHVTQLPHLRTWGVEGPPPNCSASSPQFAFPSLTDLGLGEASTPGWLSLFQHLEARVSVRQDAVTPLSKMKKSLRVLSVETPSSAPTINISFISAIRMFRNLVDLDVGATCRDGQCTFKLNNDDVTELSVALPRLERLHLGTPCSENTCATTTTCLLLISIHCPGMNDLAIHFNTTNIVGDLKNISVDPRFQELHSLPRCQLWYLDVSNMPLVLDESDFQTVVDGMRGIFPCLGRFGGTDIWNELSKKL